MPHPLITQLRFARSEMLRCLEGVSEEDAVRRLLPINSISWMVGHLANQEHTYWVLVAQNKNLFPDLYKLVGSGQPASTPPLMEMLSVWKEATAAADVFLNSLTTSTLTTHLEWKGKPRPESIGTMLLRTTYHYWFHTGEMYAVRQMMGHVNLLEFVGDMSAAIYTPETI